MITGPSPSEHYGPNQTIDDSWSAGVNREVLVFEPN